MATTTRKSRKLSASSSPLVGHFNFFSKVSIIIKKSEDKTCLHLLLPDKLRCQKCEAFCAKHMPLDHSEDPNSWSEYLDKRSKLTSPMTRCEHPWDEGKYLNSPKVRALQKKRCQDSVQFMLKYRDIKHPADTLPGPTQLFPGKTCLGWRGDAYKKLIFASMSEASKGSEGGVPPPKFPILSGFKNNKTYAQLNICCERNNAGDQANQHAYVIRSVLCLGTVAPSSTNSQKLCGECSILSKGVNNINASASKPIDTNRPVSRLTVRQAALASPTTLSQIVSSKNEERRQVTKNLKKKIARLEAKMEKKQNSSAVQGPNDAAKLRKIVQAALPHVEQKYGKESIHAKVFTNSLRMLGKPRRSARYCEEVISFAILLLQRCKNSMYDELAKILSLPDSRYLRMVKSREYDDSSDDGPCDAMIEKMWMKLQKNLGEKAGTDKIEFGSDWARDVILTFDSMHLRKGMVLSTRAGNLGAFVGVVMPENTSLVEDEFERFLDGLASDQSNQDDILEQMASTLTQNTEHHVFYATSMDPRFNIQFICGKYNQPSIRTSDLHLQIDEVTLALANWGFNVRCLASDSASTNQSFQKQKCYIPASRYIPEDVLEGGEGKRSLDGSFCVAFNNWISDEPIFVVDDPPHVLKRVGSAMENKKLRWGDHDDPAKLQPMSMDLFERVYNIHQAHNGELCLRKARKLTTDHFKGTDYSKMKVNRAAQVLSRTMAGLIDELMENKDSVYSEGIRQFGNIQNHAPFFFSRAKELCLKMDRWFDICNSKDKKISNDKDVVRITGKKAEQYAAELLDILRWIVEWKDACTGKDGKTSWEFFLTQETYDSFHYVCLSFASMLYYLAKGKGQTMILKRINQDVNEKHFCNTRVAGGSTDNPCEAHANRSAINSHATRNLLPNLLKRGNVSTQT
jgi:hypothetical protein